MLGDAVMSIPFVRSALRRRDVYVCCCEKAVPVFETVLPRDHILDWTPPWTAAEGKYTPRRWKNCGLKAWLATVRALEADEAVCVWADPRVQWVMRKAGIPTRVGFPLNAQNYLGGHDPRRRSRLRIGACLTGSLERLTQSPLTTSSLQRADYWQHHVEDWRQCASALGLTWCDESPWFPETQTCEEAMHPAVRSLHEESTSRGVPLWVLHPGARMPSKQWGAEAFKRCMVEFFAKERVPLIVIDPPDGGAPEPVGPLQVRVRTPQFADLLRVVSLSEGLLCNDSLASHLGAALGKRVVAVFGSGDPRWFAPWGKGHEVLSEPHCEFHPCVDSCRLEECVCIRGVPPQTVIERLAAVNRELQEARSAYQPE